MRHSSRLIVIAFSLFLGLLTGGAALAVAASVPTEPMDSSREQITAFASDIEVQLGGLVVVTERIDYFFVEPRHGIYREIPTRYVDPSGAVSHVPIEVRSVTDGDGRTLPYRKSSGFNGLRLQIGDADELVTGAQSYVITYAAVGALSYFSDHDELYWNVTGDRWSVPISRVGARVRLPDAVSGDVVELKCYTGVSGSTATDCRQALQGNVADFAASDFLTIVVAWPPGIVDQLVAPRPNWLLTLLPYLLPLLLGLWLWRRWQEQGRDPDGRGTLVVEYDPPKGLTPGEVGVLFDMRADQKDVSATIVDLAVRGFLMIREKPNRLFSISLGMDYELELLKPLDASVDLKRHERQLLATLFTSETALLFRSVRRDQTNELTVAVGGKRLLSQLRDERHVPLLIKKVKNELFAQLTEAGLFADNPIKVRQRYFGIAALLTVLGAVGFIMAIQRYGGFPVLEFDVWTHLPAAVMMSGIVVGIFGQVMPRRSPDGVRALETSRGFREYLKTAERYRLAWQEKEGIFEKFLPYAVAFGVVDKWAKTFADMGVQVDWYQSADGRVFNALAFGSTLGAFQQSWQTTVMQAGQRSGGSGLSGGSSGGGVGGGGGGSW